MTYGYSKLQKKSLEEMNERTRNGKINSTHLSYYMVSQLTNHDRNLQGHECLKCYINISTRSILIYITNKTLTEFHCILILVTSNNFPGPYLFPYILNFTDHSSDQQGSTVYCYCYCPTCWGPHRKPVAMVSNPSAQKASWSRDVQ